MSAARLPLAYRDSCANLLIPLNRCRQEEFYLPWKCEVWVSGGGGGQELGLTWETGRATLIREVPVPRVQAAGEEDGRAAGSKGRGEEQLKARESRFRINKGCMYISAANHSKFSHICILHTRKIYARFGFFDNSSGIFSSIALPSFARALPSLSTPYVGFCRTITY